MNFLYSFIQKPIRPAIFAFAIVFLGLQAWRLLPVLQFPQTESAAITVVTSFPGASARLIEGFITTPLEEAIAQVNGIDYIKSVSSKGVSTITAQLHLDYDTTKALSAASAKVSSVVNSLPDGAELPIISVSNTAQSTATMFIGFFSDKRELHDLSDLVDRSVRPALQAVPGVQSVTMGSGLKKAVRIWLDSELLQSINITSSDVIEAIRENHSVRSAGKVQDNLISLSLQVATDARNLDEIRQILYCGQATPR